MFQLTKSDYVRMEQKANQFAMELLLPADLLVAEFDKIKDDFDSQVHIPMLAIKCMVEVPIMTKRLEQLGLIKAFL